MKKQADTAKSVLDTEHWRDLEGKLQAVTEEAEAALKAFFETSEKKHVSSRLPFQEWYKNRPPQTPASRVFRAATELIQAIDDYRRKRVKDLPPYERKKQLIEIAVFENFDRKRRKLEFMERDDLLRLFASYGCEMTVQNFNKRYRNEIVGRSQGILERFESAHEAIKKKVADLENEEKLKPKVVRKQKEFQR